MMPRGNGRGRGGRGGSFKASSRNEHQSVHDRLGKIAVYPKANDRTKKYKNTYTSKTTNENSSIATLPQEGKIKFLSKRFLKSYYEIFDQPGRQNLQSLYSSDAFFSFSATYPMPTIGRNLLEVREPENRVSLLLHNKVNIAQALATFSPTEHLVNFLSCDVPFYIANTMYVTSMQLIVNGIFKDTSQETNPLRAFTRVFVLKQVSVEQGEPVYEIFNDLFMLQPPTPEQIKRYYHEVQINKRLSNPQANSSSTGDREPRTQDDKIRSIMSKTKMNSTGSRQLLQDCEWDETRSLEVFKTLFSENKIPQEYFTP